MRRAGTVYVKVDGRQYDAKGNYTYNLGRERRTEIVGADGVHGYSVAPQAPFIEGAVTDAAGLDLSALLLADGVTVTLELANGKTIVLREAWYSGDGNVTTEQGEIAVRWVGRSAEEVS